MAKDRDGVVPPTARTLRDRAERLAAAEAPVELPAEAERLVHELRVHQLELELQNDELRRAQAELEASRARYFELFDLAPVAYFVLSEEGLLLEANLTAAAILGVQRVELRGRPLTRWILAADQDTYYLHRRQLLETGQPQRCELRFARADTLELSVWLESTLEPDARGQLVCWTTATDISERKTLEARLAASDHLASLGLIAAGVSHEIANPLTSVLYGLECLAEGELVLPGEACELAREALAGARRIQGFAHVLGAFARVDSAERKPVAIEEVIEHAFAMAEHRIRPRAQFVRDFGQVPAVLASAGHLAQVFLNLLLNAAQAIAEGAPANNTIRVRTSLEGERVRAEVIDTGSGIAPADRGRVFEPFFTTREVGEGSGLGLSVAKAVISDLGGTIDVESAAGGGTRVVVRLPAAPPSSELRPAAARTAPAGMRDRILVVDDDAAVRKMLARALGRTHEVVLADSGKAARELLARDPRFDLLLVDLMMPGVTGVELHRWLVREHPALAARTVFISGGSFHDEYLRSVENPLLAKPFNARELTHTVEELVRSARSRDR